jgi:hypothetical protein
MPPPYIASDYWSSARCPRVAIPAAGASATHCTGLRPTGGAKTSEERTDMSRVIPGTSPDNRMPDDEEISDEPIPAMQQLLDNPFLLLFLGIAMPTVLYIVWGVMEIVGIPVAK